jgi:hypothetical protein
MAIKAGRQAPSAVHRHQAPQPFTADPAAPAGRTLAGSAAQGNRGFSGSMGRTNSLGASQKVYLRRVTLS